MLLWGAVPKVPILLWFVFLQQFSACIMRIPELPVEKTNFRLIENFEKGHFLGSTLARFLGNFFFETYIGKVTMVFLMIKKA